MASSRYELGDVDQIRIGDPTWKVAYLYPPQGSWSEAEYLQLDTTRLIEFDRGCIEVLDMPSKEHQRIARFLFLVLQKFVSGRGIGEVFFAPLPVRLWEQKFREPDLVYIRQGRSDFRGYPDGADLVMEVVSSAAADRVRDLEVKVSEYARAGIPEYWIIDPRDQLIQVNVLHGDSYTATTYTVGQTAQSTLLPGLSVPVDEVPFEKLEG
jgi:Uma2 family endonuclease